MSNSNNPSKHANANPPKYINDFSKALASEVRILLAEVGKLRDERRALQFEIAELMSVKSKHGAGGEYSPEWRPRPPESLEGAPPQPAIEDGSAGPARPAWRTVHKRPPRKDKALMNKDSPAPSPAPQIEIARPNVPAWAQWRPNPLLAPQPVAPTSSTPMATSPPPRSGLFGPSTPPPK
ncbi:hypothetical protein C8J56DRAFT_1012544 [Mycena floridula]|nr:hypothetical protein C8J56DRAFT_1012544 [Mycena floridula]